MSKSLVHLSIYYEIGQNLGHDCWCEDTNSEIFCRTEDPSLTLKSRDFSNFSYEDESFGPWSHPFIHPPMYSFIRPSIHSFFRLFVHSLNHSFLYNCVSAVVRLSEYLASRPSRR